MKRLIFTLLALIVVALPSFAQRAAGPLDFASDLQTVPVMGNTPGAFGATFQTYVALLNPTASAFTIQASLYDTAGVKLVEICGFEVLPPDHAGRTQDADFNLTHDSS